MAGEMAATESEKQMFSNWIQTILGLNMTKTALHGYVVNKWEEHVYSNQRLLESDIHQFLSDIGDGKCEQNYRNKRKRVMKCSHDTCQRFLDSLLSKERKPGNLVISVALCEEIKKRLAGKKDAGPSRNQDDNSNEIRQTRIWCLANMFMQHSNTKSAIYTKGPEDTDASLFFKMMRGCKLFEFDDCDEMYENIMEARTKLHHSPTHLLRKEEAIMFFEKMEHLLRGIDASGYIKTIQKIAEMKESTRMMMCAPDNIFQDSAKDALKLHEQALLAEIQNEHSKGYTTDDLERTLKETQDEIEKMKTQPVKYGLKSRKQVKKENQEYRQTVEEMEVIVENMETLKQKTSALKTQIKTIMNIKSAPGGNLVDILVNKVMGMDPTDAKRCLIDICSSIPRDLTCLTKDTTKQGCTCGRCICQQNVMNI